MYLLLNRYGFMQLFLHLTILVKMIYDKIIGNLHSYTIYFVVIKLKV